MKHQENFELRIPWSLPSGKMEEEVEGKSQGRKIILLKRGQWGGFKVRSPSPRKCYLGRGADSSTPTNPDPM